MPAESVIERLRRRRYRPPVSAESDAFNVEPWGMFSPSEALRRVEFRLAPQNARGCRLWTGAQSPSGYGQVSYLGRTWIASRLVYMAHHRTVLSNQELVCHTCDTPLCCSIEHLFVGSYSDNQRDSVSKGRQRPMSGESNGRAKLTGHIVAKMRSEYACGASTRQLGARYGINKATAWRIVSGRQWKGARNAVRALRAGGERE